MRVCHSSPLVWVKEVRREPASQLVPPGAACRGNHGAPAQGLISRIAPDKIQARWRFVTSGCLLGVVHVRTPTGRPSWPTVCCGRNAPIPPDATTRDIFFSRTREPRLQRELEREFFSRVVLPNGTVKTTSAHRLDDVNERVLRWLVEPPGIAAARAGCCGLVRGNHGGVVRADPNEIPTGGRRRYGQGLQRHACVHWPRRRGTVARRRVGYSPRPARPAVPHRRPPMGCRG